MVVLSIVLHVTAGLSVLTTSTAYAAPESTRDAHALGMAWPGEKCRIGSSQMPAHWTDAEKWAWNEICDGRIADFNRRLNEVLVPGNSSHRERWADGRRTLSPRFLKTILLFEPFRSATPFSGVRIIGAHVPGDIDLNEAVGARLLALQDSFVTGSVLMVRFSTPSVVSFRGTKIVGELKLNATSTGGSLFLSNAELAEVDLIGAKVGDLLVMDAATVAGKLDMDSVSTEGSLYMRGGAFVEVILRGARIGGQLSLDGATVGDRLNLDAASTGRDVLMSNGQFAQANLRGARIGGQVSLDGAHVAGDLILHGVAIEAALLMTSAEFGDVELVGARIGNQFSTVGSTFRRDLYMDASTIGTDLYMRKTTFLGDVSLLFLRVASNLDLRGAVLNMLDLSGTRIGGELLLAMAGEELEWQGCRNDSGATTAPKLDLTNVTTGVLQDTEITWPDCLEREFDGFVYGRLGGYEEGSDEMPYRRGSNWFVSWLNRDESYSPQPYRQLAHVLEASGYEDMADDVLFASLDRERSELGYKELKWWTLSFLRWSVGYGYGWGFLLPVGWAALLLIIGTLSLRCYKEQDDEGKKSRILVQPGHADTGDTAA